MDIEGYPLQLHTKHTTVSLIATCTRKTQTLNRKHQAQLTDFHTKKMPKSNKMKTLFYIFLKEIQH